MKLFQFLCIILFLKKHSFVISHMCTMRCIISTTHFLSQLPHVLPNMPFSQLHVICLLISPVSTACMCVWWWWGSLPLEWESCPWSHLQRGAVLTPAVNTVSARGEDWRAFIQSAGILASLILYRFYAGNYSSREFMFRRQHFTARFPIFWLLPPFCLLFR